MLRLCIVLILSAQFAFAQQQPPPAARAWWAQTTALANDSMRGRDTGSADYERAAQYVAAQFKASGLRPAGDAGTFFQRVAMHQVSLVEAGSSLMTVVPLGQQGALRFSIDLAMTPAADVSLQQREVVFVGYGLPDAGGQLDLHGKIALFFNNTPAGLAAADRESYPARRLRALTDAGVSAILSIDNPASTEPFHWPSAYSRRVTLAEVPGSNRTAPPLLRINPASIDALFTPHDVTAANLVRDGGKGAPLPSFATGQTVNLTVKTETRDISSPNILAILPGTDTTMAAEYVAVSAHLDGYGLGTPVLGDNLYNGALDDAAYVATLIELARDLSKHPPKRSILFCIFTGEEKGLLGSDFFTHHPTVAITQIVADLNLDQLRPIFPLRALTMQGLTDSSLGDTARGVAAHFNIELRPDREPERNLFRRADNYNFVRAGVPIASFIFGYDPGSPEERIYRDWYARRYHKPQDDLTTPIDWAAAVKFNDFFRALTLAIADDPARPHWLPASPYAPK